MLFVEFQSPSFRRIFPRLTFWCRKHLTAQTQSSSNFLDWKYSLMFHSSKNAVLSNSVTLRILLIVFPCQICLFKRQIQIPFCTKATYIFVIIQNVFQNGYKCFMAFCSIFIKYLNTPRTFSVRYEKYGIFIIKYI